MTEEIKEIIDNLKFANNPDNYMLYDYITNLQEENQKLKQQISSLNGNIKRYAKKTKNQRAEIDGLTKQRDKIKKRHEFLKQEKQKLKDKNMELVKIVDELETFLKYELYCDFNDDTTRAYQDILNKLNELKGGKNDR